MFGQAVVDPRADVGGLERIARADGVKHRHARLRRDGDVAIEILALELRAEIVREIAVMNARRLYVS